MVLVVRPSVAWQYSLDVVVSEVLLSGVVQRGNINSFAVLIIRSSVSFVATSVSWILLTCMINKIIFLIK